MVPSFRILKYSNRKLILVCLYKLEHSIIIEYKQMHNVFEYKSYRDK